MYKVEYDIWVVDEINNFVNWYLKSFVQRFNDTWIYNEDIIVLMYIDKSDNIKKEIFKEIKESLEQELVWKRLSSDGILSSTIIVWNYRLFVEYKESLWKKLRTIKCVKFHKK